MVSIVCQGTLASRWLGGGGRLCRPLAHGYDVFIQVRQGTSSSPLAGEEAVLPPWHLYNVSS